jgi:hypothetical protein
MNRWAARGINKDSTAEAASRQKIIALSLESTADTGEFHIL